MRRFIYNLIISLCCLSSAAFAQSLNLTVVINSDTHFGATDSIQNNRAAIQAINGIAGTAYPAGIGGVVGTPSGVLVSGDLTDHSLRGEWDDYTDHYPLNGGTGVYEIHYPVKELTGNHDHNEPWYYLGDTPVSDGVRERQGNLNYTWTWDGVFFASLDLQPTVESSGWLANQLNDLTPQTPVVLFQHYGFGQYDQDNWWDDWDNSSAAFLNAIAGHNVIAIVHGHDHSPQHYTWEGYDVYATGSPKTSATQSFGVMNITNYELTWAERKYVLDDDGNLSGGYWLSADVKQIADPPAPPTVHYTFKETSPGKWEVLIEVSGEATAGLSAYEVWVDGVDPELVSYEENTLGTVVNVGTEYLYAGFPTGSLVQGAVGDSFNAGNFQGSGDSAILGIGMEEIYEEGFLPGVTPLVDLDVPTLLGILSTPKGLTEENFRAIVVGLLNKTGDGFYDADDIVPTYEVIPFEMLLGDANGDGVVSAGDYASVQANFGNTGEPGIPGDANFDGVVSAGDYAIIQANFGATLSSQSVPEPTMISLLVIGAASLFHPRWKKVKIYPK